MKKILFSIIAIAVSSSLMAQEVVSGDGAASAALPFSRIVRNTAALSMGGSDAAYDAARLFSSYTLDVNAGYQKWTPTLVTSTNDIVFDASGKFADKFGAWVSFASDSSKPYTVFDSMGKEGGSFTPKDMSLKIGGSFQLNDFLAAGASFKYFSSTLTSADKYSAAAADVFVAGYFSGLSASAGVSTIGQKVGDYSLPSSAFLTAGYLVPFGKESSFRALLQTDYYFSGALSVGMGVEVGVASRLFVRGGYHYATETAVIPSFGSAGLGLKIKGIKLDAAYLFGSEAIMNTLQVTLGYQF